MRKFLLICLPVLLSAMVLSCAGPQEKSSKNRLANEKSPYLQQHAGNPVDWFPWGNEASEKAVKDNRLMIVSIGYAACHWCHVMEEETFEDTAAAGLMNRYFVSVKVDREERPDIDKVYMSACQLSGESCGWPLNIIALPDGKPVYTATYLSKEKWMEVLNYFREAWEKEPEKMKDFAEKLSLGMAAGEQFGPPAEVPVFTTEKLSAVFDSLQKNYDFEEGGMRGAPKFPMPVISDFLLAYFYQTGNTKASEAVFLTLDKMALGGIYDQIGGGFARYSVDNQWKVPHFEKMLYDNAQLISLYSAAYAVRPEPLYKKTVYESAEFLLRELQDPAGGFYSSLDADSEGEEGKFYVWTEAEIDQILGPESAIFKKYYRIEKNGNWEHGKNILRAVGKIEASAAGFKLAPEVLSEKLAAAGKKLFAARTKKLRPPLDDKILCAWNGLTIKALADAYSVFGEKRFLDAARKSADFVLKNMQQDSRLVRSYKDGTTNSVAFADDYALLAEGLIALYRADFEVKYLKEAKKLTDTALKHYYNPESGLFWYTAGDSESLIVRKTETSDQVIPSSNAVFGEVLYALGLYFGENSYSEKAEKMLSVMNQSLLQNGDFYAAWAKLYLRFSAETYEVAVVGPDFKTKIAKMQNRYLPNVFYCGSIKDENLPLLEGKAVEGETFIYVCKEKACKMPVTEVQEALNQIVK